MEGINISLNAKCPYCGDGMLIVVNTHPTAKTVICSDCEDYELDI